MIQLDQFTLMLIFVKLDLIVIRNLLSFFNIQNAGNARDLFKDFSEIFANYIPSEKIVQKNNQQLKVLLGSRVEGKNPNAIYCFDVRSNGRTNGHSNK